jgi:hypothetical protein
MKRKGFGGHFFLQKEGRNFLWVLLSLLRFYVISRVIFKIKAE